MKALDWFSPPIEDNCGYGYVAIELVTALNRAKVRTDYNSGEHNVHISWIQPEWYEGEPHQYLIGYTPWESSVIPAGWRDIFNRRDEVWTTSTYCKEVYEDFGVETPILVVPHGIDSSHYQIVSDRELNDTFVFLHIGGPTERKGGQKVIDAFLDLFEGDKSAHLIMKSTGASEARWYDKNDNLHPAFEHPQVTVIDYRISAEDMCKLYAKSHCMVYPSNGEGFGLIPFQSIATGLPTIVTNGTGMRDYAELSIPLDWKPAEGYGIHLGEWCEPDLEDLRNKMLAVYNNWEHYYRYTLNSARSLHKIQSWDAVAQMVIDHLGDKIDE